MSESTRDDQPQESLPLTLDNLEEWSVADRILQARMSGINKADAAAAERARGWLPPGQIGDDLLGKFNGWVDRLANAARPFWREQESIEINLDLDGASLTGAVAVRENAVLQVGYSKLGAKHRLRAWIDLLAVAATTGGAHQAVVIGRGTDEPLTEIFGPVGQVEARRVLAECLRIRAIGLRTPLPLSTDVAYAYAAARHRNTSPEKSRNAAEGKWKSPYGWDGPDRHPENILVWGSDRPFAEIWSWASPLSLGLTAGGEVADFAKLACAIWFPLLNAKARG